MPYGRAVPRSARNGSPQGCQMEIWESGNLGIGKSRNLGFYPLGIEVEKQGFRTAWRITGQKFQELRLKVKAFIVTVGDLSSLLCQIIMRVAGW